MKKICSLFIMIALVGMVALPTWAQTDTKELVTYDDVAKKIKETDKKPDGWHFTLKAGSSISFNDNRKVVSQPEGLSTTLGLDIKAYINLLSGEHEWRNAISLLESVSRNPLIDEFVLSADNFNYETMYLWSAYEWFGLYARFVMDTSIFQGYDVRPTEVTYAVTQLDGSVTRFLAKEFKLTGYFSPFTLKEGLGPFFRPIAKPSITIEIMLGMGARETFAKDQFALADDDATDEIEAKALETTHTVGGEALFKMWGEVWEKKIGYTLRSELMMPFYSNPDQSNLTGLEKLYNETGLRLDFKVVEWLSIAYEFKALKDPQLIDDWQIYNMVLFNLGYTFTTHVDS